MTATAEVIYMHGEPTWEGVRDEYGKMLRMGWDSVVQAAKVGNMLILLKKQCSHHGPENFNTRVKVELPDLDAMTRSRLMQLAFNMPLLEQHKPESQRAALELIAEQKVKEEPKAKPDAKLKPNSKEEKTEGYRIGWVYLLVERLGIPYGAIHNKRPEIEKHIGEFPGYFTDKAEADAFVEKYVRYVGIPDDKPSRKDLTDKQNEKLEKLLNVEYARLKKGFSDEVHKRADVEVERRCKQIEEWCAERTHEALEEATRYRLLRTEVDEHLTQDEYKFILSCLHPDRHPEVEMSKWSKAFQIFHKLEKWVDAKQPIEQLRRKGWESISPRFKPKTKD